jgi:hypothetical protein
MDLTVIKERLLLLITWRALGVALLAYGERSVRPITRDGYDSAVIHGWWPQTFLSRPTKSSNEVGPVRGDVFFDAKDVGVGVSGSYEGDQAELTGTALVGKRSLTVHVTLQKLADA